MEDGPRDIAVFLSSTFRDMQAEREVLLKRAFPALEGLCAERGARLHVVDLRWGIPPDRSGADEVIEACLREVDRCRPFFVALLGQRYGWIPGEVGDGLLRRHPWLTEYRDRSLTELEIRYGALNPGRHSPRAFFYLRDPKLLDGLPPEARARYFDDDAGSIDRLAALVTEIQRSPYPSGSYDDVEALADRLEHDLSAELETILDPAPTPGRRRAALYQEIIGDPEGTRRVQRSQLDYQRERNQVAAEQVDPLFVDRQGRLAEVEAAFTGAASVLACVGPLGAGTSHLVAHAARRVGQASDDAVVVVFHQRELRSSSPIDYLYLELAEALDLEWRGMNARAEDLEAALEAAADAGRRVLLVLDDPTERIVRGLSWAREPLPDGCRLVLATQPELLADPLPDTWRRYDVPPPSPEEAAEYVEAFFARYGKALSDAQLARFVRDGRFGSFGQLAALADELRLFGRFEEIDATLDALLAARTPGELYDHVLSRLADDMAERSRAFVELMQALVLVRRGYLTDEEAVPLLDITPLDYSRLRVRVESLLAPGAPFTVSLRETVAEAARRRFLSTEADLRRAHGRLADRYVPLQLSVRGELTEDGRAAARAFHLSRAGRLEELETFLIELDTVDELGEQLDEAWARLPPDAQARVIDQLAERVRGQLDSPSPRDARPYERLAGFFHRRGREDLVRSTLTALIAGVLVDPDRSAADMIRSLVPWAFDGAAVASALELAREIGPRLPIPRNRLVEVLARLELSPDGDERALSTATEGIVRALERDDADGLLELLRFAADLMFRANRGDDDLATLLERALAHRGLKAAREAETADDLRFWLGWIHLYGDRPTAAEAHFARLLERLPEDGRSRVRGLAGVAEVRRRQGCHAEGVELMQRALRALLAREAPAEGLAEIASSLADHVASAEAKDPDSLALLQEALARSELHDDELLAGRARIRINLGFAYWRAARYPDALEQFEAARAELSTDEEPQLFAEATAGRGYALRYAGSSDMALAAFDEAVERFDALDTEVARASRVVARLQRARALSMLGRHDEARAALEGAATLNDELGAPVDHGALDRAMAEIHRRRTAAEVPDGDDS